MNPDKPLKYQRLLSFCVQTSIMEASPWWGYFWGYGIPKVGVYCLGFDGHRDSTLQAR